MTGAPNMIETYPGLIKGWNDVVKSEFLLEDERNNADDINRA